MIESKNSKLNTTHPNIGKKNRNASKPDKDAFWGKCGECIATIYLRQNGFPAVLPDFKVYSNIKDKKFEPDLLFSKKDVRFPDCGVKTCNRDTVKLVGQMSWTFQFSNTNEQGGRDRLFDNVESNEPIVLVFVEPTMLKSRVVAVVPWRELYPLLKDPMLHKYLGVKKCLYMDDLLDAYLHKCDNVIM